MKKGSVLARLKFPSWDFILPDGHKGGYDPNRAVIVLGESENTAQVRWAAGDTGSFEIAKRVLVDYTHRVVKGG